MYHALVVHDARPAVLLERPPPVVLVLGVHEGRRRRRGVLLPPRRCPLGLLVGRHWWSRCVCASRRRSGARCRCAAAAAAAAAALGTVTTRAPVVSLCRALARVVSASAGSATASSTRPKRPRRGATDRRGVVRSHPRAVTLAVVGDAEWRAAWRRWAAREARALRASPATNPDTSSVCPRTR